MEKIDQYGRVTVRGSDIPSLLYRNIDISGLEIELDDAVAQYNDVCQRFNRRDMKLATNQTIDQPPEEYHLERASRWWYGGDGIEDHLRGLASVEQMPRLEEELLFFQRNNLMGLLSAMRDIVDRLRENEIVWGVGRGSSVASLALYLLGVHRIDPLKYGLEISDMGGL